MPLFNTLLTTLLLLCSTSIYSTHNTLTNSLPVHDWCKVEYFQPVYSLTIPANKDDTLLIAAECEVTTELPYNIAMVSAIYINTAPVTGVNGYNINRNMHHAITSKQAHYKAPYSGQYVIEFRMYCASTSAKAGDTIRVECYDRKNGTYYGMLSVVVLRRATEQ